MHRRGLSSHLDRDVLWTILPSESRARQIQGGRYATPKHVADEPRTALGTAEPPSRSDRNVETSDAARPASASPALLGCCSAAGLGFLAYSTVRFRVRSSGRGGGLPILDDSRTHANRNVGLDGAQPEKSLAGPKLGIRGVIPTALRVLAQKTSPMKPLRLPEPSQSCDGVSRSST